MSKTTYEIWDIAINYICCLVLGVSIGIGLQKCSHDYCGDCSREQQAKYIQEVANCMQRARDWDESEIFKKENSRELPVKGSSDEL